jgi:hypothetical protein
VSKYTFWSVLHRHVNIAFTEDLSHYAQGATFWQAMRNLSETTAEYRPSPSDREHDLNARLRMYHETGINRVEIFVEQDGGRFAVKCANTRSFLDTGSEREALVKYVETKAKTSIVNTGEGPGA